MARAKKKADEAKKRVKDLDPKGRAKKVKGGRTSLGDQANRLVNRDASRVVKRAGEAINDTGETFNRTLNPR